MLIFYLAIAVVTVPLGAGIAFVSQVEQKHFGNVFGVIAGSVLGVVLVMMMHLYTEVGYVTVLVMWGGFFLISALEYLTTHRHDAHEQNTHSRWGINLTVLGLSLHSLADGFNLVIAAREEMLGGALAFGILIHRLPVGTLMTVALLRNQGAAKVLVQLSPLIFGTGCRCLTRRTIASRYFRSTDSLSDSIRCGDAFARCNGRVSREVYRRKY